MPRKLQPDQHKDVKRPARRVCYSAAMSLDGFIAGPNGEADWIVIDPDLDVAETDRRFDTMLMGRRTYEAMKRMGGGGSSPGMQVYVCSRTLKPADHPDVTVVNHAAELVARLCTEPGKDVWLFGGGSLFRSLAEVGLVDTVEVGVIPVLLGGGVPLLPPPLAKRVTLKLTDCKTYPKTGTVGVEYDVVHGGGSKRRK